MVQRSELRVTKSQVRSEAGMVATMYPQASEAGIEMLRRGGNAVDAAVAAGFAIGVVEPFNSGLGGIAVMVYHEAATGRTFVIDGCGTLPAATRADQFTLAAGGGPRSLYGWHDVEGGENETGYRSVAVPGMPACLCEALERWGTLPRSDILAPAIHHAEQGYLVDWYVSLTIAVNHERMARFPESMRTYFIDSKYAYRSSMLANGADTLRQPDLARTLREIAAGGADAFYRGRTAELIARDMEANGGLITYEDLANYRTRFSDRPMRGSYRDHEVIGGLENTGFPTVLEALQILDGFDLKGAGAGSLAEYHLIAEAQRRAFLDRFEHLADSDSVDVPLTGLISRGFAESRRATIDPARADPGAGPGDPWAHQDTGRKPRPGGATAEGSTTHLTVVDRNHNMVSLVSTLGRPFGSGVVARDTGVVLNDGTMWFDPVPGHVNSLAPGRRIMTAGSPLVMLRDGKPRLAMGAPGGRRVISAMVHCAVNLVDHGMGPQQALNTSRCHSEGPATEIEQGAGPEVIEGLKTMGHKVLVREETYSSSHFGRPNGILIDDDGALLGGVNVLKPAMAIGL